MDGSSTLKKHWSPPVGVRFTSQSQARTCQVCITYEGLMTAVVIASQATQGTRALLIGAGFIGMEVAASLTQRGVHATVIETQAHMWPRFADATLAGAIKTIASRRASAFEPSAGRRHSGRGSSVGRHVEIRRPAGLRLCRDWCRNPAERGIGQKGAGLMVDNGIVVNEYLQSSHPNVYAAGDVANYMDPIFQKRRRVEHWSHAEYCGQLAGQNMAGAHTPYDLLTSVWSDLFDLHLEFAWNESEHDHVIVRGHVGDLSYFILYLKQHTLTAYFAVNASTKDFPLLQRAIKQHKNVSGKESLLQDPSIPLRSII
jgi:3-phenylpropionate/trans-cinnamate dioxygenase ferredoxin reductase component